MHRIKPEFVTKHFRTSHEQKLREIGQEVSRISNKVPRDDQWGSFFFACLNNTLLVQPSGYGKHFVAEMVMKAYSNLNIGKKVFFITRTGEKMEQHASKIEEHTGMRVQKLGRDYGSILDTTAEAIVCTHGYFKNAINDTISSNCMSLIVLDEALGIKQEHGEIISKINWTCNYNDRPRVFAISGPPRSTSTISIEYTIGKFCELLSVQPFWPELANETINQTYSLKLLGAVVKTLMIKNAQEIHWLDQNDENNAPNVDLPVDKLEVEDFDDISLSSSPSRLNSIQLEFSNYNNKNGVKSILRKMNDDSLRVKYMQNENFILALLMSPVDSSPESDTEDSSLSTLLMVSYTYA